MAHRLALIVALVPLLLAAPSRGWLHPAPRPAGCAAVTRGEPPRHWLACLPGPARPEALAFVPGLSRRLAVAVAADRTARGRFESVDDLRRVGGIGERRLAQARGALEVAPP